MGCLSGLGCEIPLPMGTEMCVCVCVCVCVRRVVDYSSLVMHGRIHLMWHSCVWLHTIFQVSHTHNGDDTLPSSYVAHVNLRWKCGIPNQKYTSPDSLTTFVLVRLPTKYNVYIITSKQSNNMSVINFGNNRIRSCRRHICYTFFTTSWKNVHPQELGDGSLRTTCLNKQEQVKSVTLVDL